MHSGGQRFDPAILHQETFSYLICKYNYYQYLYPIVRIDEQSMNVRIDEHSNKNLIYNTENFFLCINQAFKGVWRMPRH